MVVQIFNQTDEYIDINLIFGEEDAQMREWLMANYGPNGNGWENVWGFYRIYKHNKEKFTLFQLTWL